MTASPLTLEGFRDLLDRHGGDLAHWPAGQVAAALALLECSPEARALLDQAQDLDAALASPSKAPPGLGERIVAAALGQESKHKN